MVLPKSLFESVLLESKSAQIAAACCHILLSTFTSLLDCLIASLLPCLLASLQLPLALRRLRGGQEDAMWAGGRVTGALLRLYITLYLTTRRRNDTSVRS